MAITFTNTIHDKIIDNLATIIHNEFNIPIKYSEHRGNQSFLLTPESDAFIEHLNSGITREYTVNIEYQLKSAGEYSLNNLKQVSNIMERFKRLVFNNISYSNGDVWFDARVTSIEYIQDEDDKTLLKGLAVFNCTNIEII